MFEDVMHYLCRTHFQFCLLSHRPIDDHIDIIHINSTLVSYSDLTTHRKTFVASDCELTSHIKLESLVQN